MEIDMKEIGQKTNVMDKAQCIMKTEIFLLAIGKMEYLRGKGFIASATEISYLFNKNLFRQIGEWRSGFLEGKGIEYMSKVMKYEGSFK